MNEQGRTVSKLKLRGYRASETAPSPNDQDEAIRLLRAMPYAAAAAIRQTALHAGSISASYVIDLLNKAKVAMDVQ